MSPSTAGSRLATVDKRPYFEKALSHGVRHAIIDDARCGAIITDAAKGTVQVANYFGSSHLFTALDNARRRIVHLVSLYLEDRFGSDLAKAAQSLQENTFLSHSRGGNELLKQLHALPEAAMFEGGSSQTLKEFQDQRTLDRPLTHAAYRKELARRQANAASLAAARWFAQDMDMPASALEAFGAEAVVRTALLIRAGGGHGCPNMAEFATLITKLRSSMTGTKAKEPAAKATTSGRLKFARGALDDIPESHRPIADLVRREMDRHDAPLLANAAVALDAVMHMLEPRYFLRDTGMEDIDAYDAIVSKEWKQLTKGKEDDDSRLTMFLCLAAGVRPKTTLSTTEARALVRRVRMHGFDEASVPALIRTSAPFSIRESLLSMWEDDFYPEAKLRLLDTTDPKLVFAMQFLAEHCNIAKK